MAATVTKAYLKEAVHHNKALSKQGLLERAFTLWFRGFVYNQIWEDPRVDAEALGLGPHSRLLTISSGGCNVLNYLIHRPERIVAVDLNTSHMCLTRLKLAALTHLPSHHEFFNFFGLGHHHENLENYRRYIRDHLDADTRKFWEKRTLSGRRRISIFARGFYNYGKMARLFRLAHRVARLTRKDPARLLEATSREEQEQFFREVVEPFFENRLVRVLGRSPMTSFSLGIPPSQFDVMHGESEGRMIELYRERLWKLTCEFPLDDNYFAWQAFGRRYDHENKRAIPDYLREENYDLLRSSVDCVETRIASLGDYLKDQPEDSLNGFVLLDSQDWMPPTVIASLWEQMARVGGSETRVIFRTAGELSPVETALPPDLKEKFQYELDRSRELHDQDRSAIYGMFHLYRMTA